MNLRIFYLNCFRLLKKSKDGQRDWLIKKVCEYDVDVICLSESSNFDFGNTLPELFPEGINFRWNAPESNLAKLGYKFNICSRQKVTFHSIDYTVSPEYLKDGEPNALADYGIGTMISMKFEDKGTELVCVHIQHKKDKSQTLSPNNAFYEFGLRTLRDYMIANRPIAVFGDFNNYPDDKSFLALTDNTGYWNAKSSDVQYTYRNSANDPGSVIDHAFTNSKKVKMDYIPAIGIEHGGFNHDGMLINIE